MSNKEITAKAKYIRQSPRKIRAVANQIRHLPLTEAVEQLSASVKKAATPLKKVLLSAIANAENNLGINRDSLRIKYLQVGPGPTLRRIRYRARGRADTIRRRSANIYVVLEETITTKKDAPIEKEDKSKGEKKTKEKKE